MGIERGRRLREIREMKFLKSEVSESGGGNFVGFQTVSFFCSTRYRGGETMTSLYFQVVGVFGRTRGAPVRVDFSLPSPQPSCVAGSLLRLSPRFRWGWR